MKSIIKNVISILVITVIGMFVGYYIGSSKNGIGRAAEDKMEYNKTIAIVNLDEGIEVQGNEENYGMRLTDMVSDDIIVTGLEDARKGVELCDGINADNNAQLNGMIRDSKRMFQEYINQNAQKVPEKAKKKGFFSRLFSR